MDKQKTNYMKERLVGVIETNFSSQVELSKVLGITYQSLNNKMNRRCEFTRKEIKNIATYYDLNEDDLWYIFFSDEDDDNDVEFITT